MALEIIGFARSNFVRTVRMVAQEKGVHTSIYQPCPIPMRSRRSIPWAWSR